MLFVLKNISSLGKPYDNIPNTGYISIILQILFTNVKKTDYPISDKNLPSIKTITIKE